MTTPQQEVIQTLGLERRRRRFTWVWVVLPVAIGVAVYLSRQGPDTPPVEYITETPHRGSLRVTVTATGTLQPTRQVEIGSEVSGIIKEVLVDFNEQVHAGQVIARLDTQQLEARLASTRGSLSVAEASLSQARASLAEADAKARRSRELFGQHAISEQDLETNEAALLRAAASVDSARAQVNSARAMLTEAETALSKATITAPIDGIIISRDVDPGQTVAASFQTPVMFVIAADLTQMVLHLDVDESDIGMVREGQHASFRVDAYPRREFDAEIVSVRFHPREVNNIVTYETVLAVTNPELLLRPGMTATAEILVEQRAGVLLVPNRSLRFLPADETLARAAPSGDRVWVLENGQAVPVGVAVGLSDGEFTEIASGNITTDTALIVDLASEPERQRSFGSPFGG